MFYVLRLWLNICHLFILYKVGTVIKEVRDIIILFIQIFSTDNFVAKMYISSIYHVQCSHTQTSIALVLLFAHSWFCTCTELNLVFILELEYGYNKRQHIPKKAFHLLPLKKKWKTLEWKLLDRSLITLQSLRRKLQGKSKFVNFCLFKVVLRFCYGVNPKTTGRWQGGGNAQYDGINDKHLWRNFLMKRKLVAAD